MSDTVHSWQMIRFTVAPEATEAMEFALNSLDALGTSIDLMPASANIACVVGYFTKFPGEQTVQDEIHYALKSYGLDENAILSVERSEIANTDWLAEWKKYWKPTTIGNFVISAPWHEVEDTERIVIRIEPNMAFGTGTHETTQLCLQAIDELIEPGDSFLDVGTGTGILAIAAALKSRNTSGCALLGVDIDFGAINIARENAALNDVGGSIEFRVGPIDESIKEFDFVCANLTLDVILPILPLLLQKTRKYLVISGILKTQEETISNELKRLGADDLKIDTAGEWIAAIIDTQRAV